MCLRYKCIAWVVLSLKGRVCVRVIELELLYHYGACILHKNRKTFE